VKDSWAEKQERAFKDVKSKLENGRLTVTVIGWAKEKHGNEEGARAVGALVARLGFNLVTGGRNGVMADVSRGFVAAGSYGGVVIGVLPEGKEQMSNKPPQVEVVQTDLPGERDDEWDDETSRNHVNIRAADKVVALPGGLGTCGEARLAVERYSRPICAFQPRVNHASEKEWFTHVRELGINVVHTLGDVERFLR